MSLKAQVRTDSMGNITVHIEGGIDFENCQTFRQELVDLTKDHPMADVTLDLNRLDFVGSSGIGHFVETIKIVNKSKEHFKLSNVKTEFMKVFKLYGLDPMDLLEKEFDLDETEHLSQRFANRKRTFEN